MSREEALSRSRCKVGIDKVREGVDILSAIKITFGKANLD